MPKPKVTIITPTKMERRRFLPMLWDCVRNQTIFQDIEWRILDTCQDAATFDWLGESSVHYEQEPVPGRLTIGAKRNILCNTAQADIIVHFDDDDYYAPHYIEDMLSLMTERNVDFVKLFGFFLYQRAHEIFAYWDLEADFPLHWKLAGNEPPIQHVYRGGQNAAWGYGFSYVYRRAIWSAFHFPETPRISGDQRGFGEDQIFADAVPNDRKSGKQDYCTRSCIHVVHGDNMSIKFPQKLLRRELLPQLFTDFDPQTR